MARPVGFVVLLYDLSVTVPDFAIARSRVRLPPVAAVYQ